MAFIISGLAPNLRVCRINSGYVKRPFGEKPYLKLQNELNMSSGQIIEVIDEIP